MAIFIYYYYFLLVLFVPHEANSISFNFSNISPQNLNNDIVTTDYASISNDGMQLIPDQGIRAGRGMYNRLVHIWDNTSRELSSFSSNFSFVIKSDMKESFFNAYGFTFFLAENNSVAGIEGAMGLPFNTSTQRSLHKFVAVEFDTHQDEKWDPAELSRNDYHAGINVNSLNSSVFKKWSINIPEGAHCQASVTYDSVSKNLSASITDDVNGVIDLSYIVDLRDVLPEWVIFGFSASTASYLRNVTIKSWSFNSLINLQVDEQTAQPPTTNQNPVKGSKKSGNKVGLIAGLVVVLFVSAIVVFYYIWRRIKHKRPEVRNHKKLTKEFKQGTGPKEFSYSEILQATTHFAETNKLGEGGFGGVYKGFLKDPKTYIAVKRVSKTSQQGIREYTAEVEIISQLRHKNLVELKGWCHEKSELLLIYEFMENGSLDLHLFKQKSWLTWEKRKKIVHGLASALFYLHEGCKKCNLHRDIKSSNVMLDSNFDAKLGDFGLAKLVDHEKGSQATIVAGTHGYMAPEYASTGTPSKESDVYSFGVVALEIACGRKPFEYKADEERPVILVEWVRDLYETGNILRAVDPSIGSYNKEQIERLMIVGLWCAHPLADQWLSMEQAIQILNHDDAPLPKLPSKMPKITSSAPPNPHDPEFFSIP
uniref:L-type lectin-domain containing receptor kinase IX.1-like n=1 Tax=Erigeron canadensis TaxID=72917 RepID=UPI001CB8BC41|nr:L-type lectin-domain containing receptor kinase IX.1-like [Erigeron canadensis]